MKGSLVNRKTKVKTKEVSHITYRKRPQGKFMKSHFEGSKKNLRNLKKKNEEVFNYKDVNFLESDDIFIIMSQKDKDFFIENLTKDAYFLKEHNIMDYSLLFTIAEESFPPQTASQKKNTYKSWRAVKSCPEFKQESWSFAIIDYLQEFNKFKFLESRYKELLNYKNSYYVSCINPKTYAERFINFMNSITCALTNKEAEKKIERL